MALEDFRAKFSTYMSELVGTAVLLLIIQLSTTAGNAVNAPLTIGIGLAAVVYAGGPISGAHYNPAVTLAVLLRGKITPHELIGGLCGALLGRMIGGDAFVLRVGKGHNLLQAWLGELVFTAILCYVVLATATSSKTEGNSYYGLAIGSVVFVGASSVGAISGGAFNPAVVFGLGSVANFLRIFRFGYSLWIILADLAGGVLGAFIYYITAPEEFKHFGENLGDLSDEARSLLPTSEGRH